MKRIKWGRRFAVGVRSIDDEHQELFRLTADLEQAVAAEPDAKRLRAIMSELLDHIEEHFAHEEERMRATGCGSYEWHKRQHDVARGKAAALVPGIQNGDPGTGMILLSYLSEWLNQHIRISDRIMAAHFQGCERAARARAS